MKHPARLIPEEWYIKDIYVKLPPDWWHDMLGTSD